MVAKGKKKDSAVKGELKKLLSYMDSLRSKINPDYRGRRNWIKRALGR